MIYSNQTIHFPFSGVHIARGGANDLFLLPERRPPLTNDWAEHAGVEVDLSTPLWKPRTVEVEVHASPDAQGSISFALRRAFYTNVYVSTINSVFRLRYLDCVEYKHRGGYFVSPKRWATARIRFSNDDPLQLFEGVTAQAHKTNLISSHIRLNNVDLCEYGIVVRQAYNSLYTPSPIKQGLVVESEYRTGVKAWRTNYFESKSRTISLDCTLRADSPSALLQTYKALWEQLSRPEPLLLNSSLCYYSSMSNLTVDHTLTRIAQISFTLNFQTI